MLITSRPSWFVSETEVTPENVYINRREWLRAAGFAGLGLTSAASFTARRGGSLTLELVAPRAPLLSVCLSVYLPISPSMLPSLIIHGSAVCPQAQQAAALQAT